MEMSSDEDEDGQISKQDQQDERTARLLDLNKKDEDEALLVDFNRARLPRDALIKYHRRPWFPEYARGKLVAVFLTGLCFMCLSSRFLGSIPSQDIWVQNVRDNQ